MNLAIRHHTSAEPRRGRGERGSLIPLVALSMVAILLVVTLVLDGSQAYPQRRSAQNGADAAATAGASALDRAKWFGGPVSDIYLKAKSVAVANKAAGIDCEYINTQGVPVTGPLGTPSCGSMAEESSMGQSAMLSALAVGGVPLAANGVRITTYVDRPTTFGALSGRTKVTAKARAAATVQKLKTTGSPFIVCANPSPHPDIAPPPGRVGWDILKTNPAVISDWSIYDRPWDPPFVFNADGSVDLDPTKVAAANNLNGGKGIALVGSEPRVPRCGVSGGNFDGNGSMDLAEIPSWIGYSNGGGHSEAASEVVVSTTPCPDPFPTSGTIDCDVLLPIAIDGNTPAHPDQLRVVAMAVFHVSGTGVGNPKYYGKIRADIHYVAGGQTTVDPVTASSLRVVRIIE
jgi:hypothetical protein